MRPRYLFLITGIGVLAAVCAPAFTPAASHQAPMAASEKVIYSFQGGTDGWWPASDLTLDPEGNLYGTTSQGGAHSAGTVFRLKHTANGWKEELLYSFKGTNDGSSPIAGVVFDNAGNLYGTGSGYVNGYATVFKLSPDSHGQWTETVLYTSDARTYFLPNSDLVFDVHGNLFGALGTGGDFNGGFVFELIPQPKGLWKEVTLHAFKGADGAIPSSAVALDSSGNVWGATQIGGTGICTYYKDSHGCGVVYKLTPGSGGKWTESVVYNFIRGGGNAVIPSAGFFLRDRHLFGTSLTGGDGLGTFFELKPSQKDWTQQILYRFYGYPDGEGPIGRLEMGPHGELFGVTGGGGYKNVGTVFALRDSTQGWKESVLYAFGGSNDGYLPMAGVVSDSQGHLYGTTFYGGGTVCEGGGCGTVYEVTLSSRDH
jgi:uncharacterized repeat protein (TIGR03803 family)